MACVPTNCSPTSMPCLAWGHGSTVRQGLHEFFTSNDTPDWELAFTHAILAQAAHVAGDAGLHASAYAAPTDDSPTRGRDLRLRLWLRGRLSFIMKNGPGEIALWLPKRFGHPYLVLGRVRAASGARYEGDGVTVRTKGDDASLVVDDESFTGCRHDRRRSIWEHAKLSGVDFRAIGNEPGWHLEIRRSLRLTFVYAYGEQRVVTPCPEPSIDVDAQRTVYQAGAQGHDLKVVLEGTCCTDTMSDEQFETTVTVDFDGVIFRGCGRALH